jgi:hypothetical protein
MVCEQVLEDHPFEERITLVWDNQVTAYGDGQGRLSTGGHLSDWALVI